MNKEFLVCIAGVAVLVSGCATTKQIPLARKLTPELMRDLGQTDVVVVKNRAGITAGWTSAAYNNQGGFQNFTYAIPPGTSPVAAGIGAGIGQAIAIAILDAAPSARARKSANKINTGLDRDDLNRQMVEKLKSAMSEGPVKIGDVSVVEFDRKTPDPDDKFKIAVQYMLAEDASALRVKAVVSYNNSDLSYQTPYDFGGKIPKSQKEGPLYWNTFTYDSDRFEAPALTPEVKTKLVSAINAQYDEEIAELRLSDMASSRKDKKIRKLTSKREKALKAAQDEKLSKTEKATLLIDKWRGDKSPVLSKSISDAQSFIAEYVVRDINDSHVPVFEPSEEIKIKGKDRLRRLVDPTHKRDLTVLATSPEGRKVVRLDSGPFSGEYFSYPESGFASYGNTQKVAEKNR